MKKINLKSYDIEFKDKEGNDKYLPYDVKSSLVNVLFHPKLKLSGRDLLLAQKLAEKIEECIEDNILLEEQDYNKLKNAVEKIEGFSKNDVEFVKRVLEAETVKVQEKEGKNE